MREEGEKVVGGGKVEGVEVGKGMDVWREVEGGVKGKEEGREGGGERLVRVKEVEEVVEGREGGLGGWEGGEEM